MKKSIFLITLILSLFLAGCGKKDVSEPEPTLLPPSAYSSQRPPAQPSFAPEIQDPEYQPPSTYAEGEELFAKAESLDAAKELAELYGIKLVNYQSGYATYHTEESPAEVIRRGEANDWPKLEVNHTGKAD